MNTKGVREVSFASIYICFLVVIVTFFFMISLAPKVCAETAWVEWEHETHQTIKSNNVTFDKWHLIQPFPSYQECMSTIHSKAKNACNKDGMYGDSDLWHCNAGDDYFRYSSDEEITTLEFHCYPDGSDPRDK